MDTVGVQIKVRNLPKRNYTVSFTKAVDKVNDDICDGDVRLYTNRAGVLNLAEILQERITEDGSVSDDVVLSNNKCLTQYRSLIDDVKEYEFTITGVGLIIGDEQRIYLTYETKDGRCSSVNKQIVDYLSIYERFSDTIIKGRKEGSILDLIINDAFNQ